jgi:hypothetical protein
MPRTKDSSGPGVSERAKQCREILSHLRAGPLSTLDAREKLGILHPAGRILELKRAGFSITAQRSTVYDSAGRAHASATYHLSSRAVIREREDD